MPTYEYECLRCGHLFEEEAPITAPPRQRCPTCRGRVRRLLGRPAIVFKGSGFYVTDSRRQSGGNGSRPAAKRSEKADTGSKDTTKGSTSDKT
jgi:putative FmdB family regulatory protein